MVAMKKKDKNLGREDGNDEELLLSLQSEERRKVYLYLRLIFPAWATIGEIAREIKSDYRNVLGALKGDGKRYSKKLALISVDLVEYKKGMLGRYKIYLYRAKRKG